MTRSSSANFSRWSWSCRIFVAILSARAYSSVSSCSFGGSPRRILIALERLCTSAAEDPFTVAVDSGMNCIIPYFWASLKNFFRSFSTPQNRNFFKSTRICSFALISELRFFLWPLLLLRQQQAVGLQEKP